MLAIDIVGYAAAALVLVTFCMQSMSSLRVFAILSNLAFITYAYHRNLVPILLLHVILLPVNASATLSTSSILSHPSFDRADAAEDRGRASCDVDASVFWQFPVDIITGGHDRSSGKDRLAHIRHAPLNLQPVRIVECQMLQTDRYVDEQIATRRVQRGNFREGSRL